MDSSMEPTVNFASTRTALFCRTTTPREVNGLKPVSVTTT